MVLQVPEILWKSYGNQWKSMEGVLQWCCKSWESYGNPMEINGNQWKGCCNGVAKVLQGLARAVARVLQGVAMVLQLCCNVLQGVQELFDISVQRGPLATRLACKGSLCKLTGPQRICLQTDRAAKDLFANWPGRNRSVANRLVLQHACFSLATGVF